MLINTVILFIRDTLPIFLLFSLLLLQRPVSIRMILAGITAGLLLAIVLYVNLPVISPLAEGGGVEMLKSVALGIAFFSFCALMRNPERPVPAVLVVTGAITLVNAIHFIIYFVAYWPAQQADMALMMGIVIGLGISCSVSILLFMLLDSPTKSFMKKLVLTVFLAGQVAGVANQLEQINVLPEQARLWDTSAWLADDSEYGHFFNVLLGYEATPIPAYLMLFVLALLLPLILYHRQQIASKLARDGRSH